MEHGQRLGLRLQQSEQRAEAEVVAVRSGSGLAERRFDHAALLEQSDYDYRNLQLDVWVVLWFLLPKARLLAIPAVYGSDFAHGV